MELPDDLPLISDVEYTILFTDTQLVYQGDPIYDWESIDVTLRRNEPSSGMFVIPAHPEIEQQLPRPALGDDPGVPERRVVCIRDLGPDYGNFRHVLLAGPIESWIKEQSDDGENSGIGKLTIHWANDMALIAARAAYPDVTKTPEEQQTDNWQMTAAASTALYALVNGNAGPGARPERQVPKLVMTGDAAIGGNVTVKAQRMEPVGNVMRAIADVGGGLNFRTYQALPSEGDREIRFEVTQPPDKTKKVFFGFGAGNLKYRSVEVKAPTSTTAIIGGQGEGADRALITRTNTEDESTWGRFETLVSRPGNGPMQDLQDEGDRELAGGASTIRVTANVSDVPSQRFGIAYDLGDRVSVEISDGKSVSDVVSTIHVQAWNGAGEYISPTVGSQADQTAPAWKKRLDEIEQRLGRVERSVVPATPA